MLEYTVCEDSMLTLSHGVMVAQQVLVLFVGVRIPIRQQRVQIGCTQPIGLGKRPD